MKKLLFGLFVIFPAATFFGCSAKPTRSAVIVRANLPIEVPAIAGHKVRDPVSEIDFGLLSAHNKMAGMPSFGVIKGFYQLPEAFPHGAISLQRMQSFGYEYESVKVSRLSTRPYVVTPASAGETEAISQTMNRLLDAHIRFVEVSLADAVKIMEAERAALQKNVLMFPHSSVPSGVDLLVSVEKGYGSYGPIYVGRVIRTKDGRLCALTTVSDVGPRSLGPLVSQLVKDSLRRLGEQS
jgi:hypothetical protein